MKHVILRLRFAAMVIAGAGIVLAAIGQALALATFLSRVPASLAISLTSREVIAGMVGFAAFWLVAARRQGLGPERARAPGLLAGVDPRLRHLCWVLAFYWGIAFIGLFFLGGIDNKGIEQIGTHFFTHHSDGRTTEISGTEYHRQAAYELWMFSAWTLLWSTIVLTLAKGATVARSQHNAASKGKVRGAHIGEA